MPIGIFKPAGEDPHDDARADVHDRQIYGEGLGYLTSGKPHNRSNDPETRGWLRRMEGASQRMKARNEARQKRGR